jgi:hypothetical protein
MHWLIEYFLAFGLAELDSPRDGSQLIYISYSFLHFLNYTYNFDKTEDINNVPSCVSDNFRSLMPSPAAGCCCCIITLAAEDG